jgi:hypothetical protein
LTTWEQIKIAFFYPLSKCIKNDTFKILSVPMRTWKAFRKDRLTDSGGGILIYIRNTLLGRRRLDLEVPEVESVCLEIFADNRKFLLVCLYRPPNARVSSWDYIDN